MEGGGDDPADAERDRAGENRGRDVALFADLFPEIERRKPDDEGEGDDEDQDSERGEDDAVEQRNIGHTRRVYQPRQPLLE